MSTFVAEGQIECQRHQDAEDDRDGDPTSDTAATIRTLANLRRHPQTSVELLYIRDCAT